MSACLCVEIPIWGVCGYLLVCVPVSLFVGVGVGLAVVGCAFSCKCVHGCGWVVRM